MWKFKGKIRKETWLVMLAVGMVLLILAYPDSGNPWKIGVSRNEDGAAAASGTRQGSFGAGMAMLSGGTSETASSGTSLSGTSAETSSRTSWESLADSSKVDGQEVSAPAGTTYEAVLEQRVKELLSHVDGVGTVDVMITIKSSEEKVLRVDNTITTSRTEEKDSTGGTRTQDSTDQKEATILTGSGDSNAPIVEKELKPEIEGIVISATGGDNATVKAEISAAMEALFDVPAHKIKVLKRA